MKVEIRRFNQQPCLCPGAPNGALSCDECVEIVGRCRVPDCYVDDFGNGQSKLDAFMREIENKTNRNEKEGV